MRTVFLLALCSIILIFGSSAFSQTAQKLTSFKTGELWPDDKGEHINAHGGGMLIHNGKYYWFGEHKGEQSNAALVGVTCYSSDDLYNWKNEGIALEVSDDSTSLIVRGCTLERPKVIYNEKTGKFVMYFHLELRGQGYNAAYTGRAVSDRVAGPYTFLGAGRVNPGVWPMNMPEAGRTDTLRPNQIRSSDPRWREALTNGLYVRRDFEGGQMSRDMQLYVDDNGKAYHIYAAEENYTLNLAELTDDYLGYTGRYITIDPGGHNEAPALFKKNGVYFMITSGCTGWTPNAARLYIAPTIWGPWTRHPNPCIGENADSTFHSQSTCIIPVQGKKDAFIYMGDRWRPRNPIDGRYIWLPILFNDGLPVLKWFDEWDLSIFDEINPDLNKPKDYPGWQLVWNDEFDYSGAPDTSAWSFEYGFVRNNENQWYQPQNAVVGGGILTIKGRIDRVYNPNYEKDHRSWQRNRPFADYTSACIKTRGKKEFLYGRFEVRAKIPVGKGSWPAIWTIGNSMGWPNSGEIDIMEYYPVKGVPQILANVAWGSDTKPSGEWRTKMFPYSKWTDIDPHWDSKFHIWRMDWDEQYIRLYLDDELLNETPLSETINGEKGQKKNPFKQPHYLLLNLALGGAAGGPIDDKAFPMDYEIDYVRVYQKTGSKAVGAINGEPFFQEDLDVYTADLRAAVAAYYGQKYGLSGAGAGFWDTDYDGFTPYELLNKLAVDNLTKNMVMLQEARNRGIDAPQTYNDLEKERAEWNSPTDRIVFGPKTLAPAEYNSYRISGISDALKTAMLQNELTPSADQLRESFESLSQDYKIAPYSATGIRFSWDERDEDIHAEIAGLLQQGLSPEDVTGALSTSYLGFSQEEFQISSRHVSKSNDYELELAGLLRETTNGAFVPGPEEQPELYYVTQKEGGGLYSFEEAPGLGRNKWINDRFEEFITEKTENAAVVFFVDILENKQAARPIDLSKYTTVTELEGTGTLISRGRAKIGATTYFVDFTNGDDANSGTSALKPWKTFRNVNTRPFNPGDHILLEANSIWNGTPADKDNYITQARQRGNGGMLAPAGNGLPGNPCVIDLYEIKETANGLTVYWSANRRPVINGNGTPSLNSENPYGMSGTIQLEGQNYWEIRHVEVTNSYDFPNIGANPALLQTHWYKREVPKSLVAILATSTTTQGNCTGILIENCYLHDVQSLHNNNRGGANDWPKSEHFGMVAGNPGKSGGGIMGGFTESTIQGNIIRRVALEGFHSSQRTPGVKFIFRGNYIESAAGDGIVISNFVEDNLVESNLVKNACAAPNFGVGNYASNWTYRSNNVLFQYNEGWGTLYGYQDGEAWDVDDYCDRVIYQYNYSHHNAGGTILFMNNQTNSIFRYNISANDGGGSRYMSTVVSPGTQAIDTETEAYQSWTKGQSLIHYGIPDSVPRPTIPLIHNNTFYIGEGINVAVLGCVGATWPDKYVRFYNNLILKTGSGEVRISDMHRAGNPFVLKSIKNPEGFKNNLLYAYETDRKQGDKTKFLSGKITMDQWIKKYGNIWADPMLKIQEAGGEAALRKQRDDPFPETDYANADKLKEYIGISRLRMRASLFTPLQGSPVIEAGMKIPPGESVRELDDVWNGNYGALSDQPVHWDNITGLTKDMFGNTINAAKPPIGGAVKAYP